MMRGVLVIVIVSMAFAAESYKPTDEEKQQIRAKLAEFTAELHKVSKPDEELLPDVQVYGKAAEWILRHEEEFYAPEYVANTLRVLETGITRAKQMAADQASWTTQKGRLVRAYRSAVDNSVQPYGLVIPESYDGQKPVRLDVVLHGRGATLNEVSFITAHDSDKPLPEDQNYIQLDVFGRTNNAYRWSGETDVFEALASVRKRYKIDPDRIVLRGFSMGGAGAWHIGLQHPDEWAAIEAGAGFVETNRYAKLSKLPPHQQAMLHIYDALDYALNGFNLPLVGYGGEDDPQLAASQSVKEQMAKEGVNRLRALFLIGPQTGHKFHPESQKESDAFVEEAVRNGRQTPNHIRFVTYTTRFNRCFWITVDGLENHYQRAEVDAQRTEDQKQQTLKTTNIWRLLLPDPTAGQRISIDGENFTFPEHTHAAPAVLVLEKKNGKWTATDESVAQMEKETTLRKKHALQGPIDDAFMDPFLCVRPTGAPKFPLVNDFAKKELDRLRREFTKWLRGDPMMKDDTEVSKEDIANYHLVLFGDPGSNRIIHRIEDKLPLKFRVSDQMLVMIYPNPLNPKRYVVINSGHTFHDSDFRGSNALLFPRLGDYAVVNVNGELLRAGLFDNQWQISTGKTPPEYKKPGREKVLHRRGQ